MTGFGSSSSTCACRCSGEGNVVRRVSFLNDKKVLAFLLLHARLRRKQANKTKTRTCSKAREREYPKPVKNGEVLREYYEPNRDKNQRQEPAGDREAGQYTLERTDRPE